MCCGSHRKIRSRWVAFLKGCLGLLSRERALWDVGGNREPCEEVGTGRRVRDDKGQDRSGGRGGAGNGQMAIWKVDLTGLGNRLDWGGEGGAQGRLLLGPEQPEERNCHVQ